MRGEDGRLPHLAEPITAEEAARLRESFRWEDTTPLAETSPDRMPALYYTVIELDGPEDAELLDSARVLWDVLPLFPAELEALGVGEEGFVFMPGEGGYGTFVFALLPGSMYNIAREAALAGEIVFPLVVLRDPPSDVPRHPDGSLDVAWLIEQGFCYPGTCGLDGGEAASAMAPLRDESDVGSAAQPITEIVHDAIEMLIRAGEAVFNFFLDIFGAAATLVLETADLTLEYTLAHADPDFDPAGAAALRRAWGITRGAPIDVRGATVVMTAMGGAIPGRWTGTLDAANVTTITVPDNANYVACIRTETPRALVTGGFLPVAACTPGINVLDDIGAALIPITVADANLQILAVVGDGADYLAAMMQFPARRTTVLVGNLANLLSVQQTPYAPCLGGRGPGSVLVATGLDAVIAGILAAGGGIPFWGIPPLPPAPPGTTGAEAVVFLLRTMLNKDIVMPDAMVTSRIVTAHEFGHVAFCQMMEASSLHLPVLFAQHWLTIIGQILMGGGNPNPALDPIVLNEAFADYYAGQLAGGANRLRGEMSSYPGDLGLAEDYCLPAPGCFDENLTDVGPGVDLFNERVSRYTTILHDIFDGQPFPGNLPHNATVWNTQVTPCGVPGAPACRPVEFPVPGPGPELMDEPIAVGAAGMLVILGAWLLDPLEAFVFTDASLMHAATRMMRLAGNADADICLLYTLHTAAGGCPPAWMAP